MSRPLHRDRMPHLSSLTLAMLALSAVYSPSVLAICTGASFTIQSGQTVTTQQCLSGNQTGIIQSGGSLVAHDTGISATGSNNVITNMGSIRTTFASAYGIYSVVETNATINNSGNISSSSDFSYGIYSSSDTGTTIDNSGLISVTGSGSDAIYANGSSNLTLNIRPGSRILGAIDLGGGAGNVANVYGTGGSAVMSIANAQAIHVYAPNAVLVGTDTVVTVEPTGESSRGAALDGLTSSLQNIIGQRMAAPRPFQPVQVAALTLSPGMLHQDQPPMAWGQFFGSGTRREADGQMLEQHGYQAGAMGGYEQNFRNGRAGFLAGVAHGNLHTATFKDDTNTAFAGVYGHYNLSKVNLTASLLAGVQSHDQSRVVLDNLLGYQTATSSPNSVFLSPSVTLGQIYAWSAADELRPSATLTYSVGRYDSYTETGTTNANLHVDARTVQAYSGRLQLEAAHHTSLGEVDIRIGAEARHAGDDSINMSVGGSSFSFQPMGNLNASGGYLGAGADLNLNKRLTLLADAEIARMTGGEKTGSGQVTLQYWF